ncbi:MAG TPA: FG-GAP-like repeat-containing protein [Anaerolineales bacterium]|nr:FG-GAP-like repeat-containing protein [Anaerolineales bacterium]
MSAFLTLPPKRFFNFLMLTGTLSALVLMLWQSTPQVSAAQIPFGTEIVVSDNFDGAVGLSTVDLDGDGDWDILGAAQNLGQLAWWANLDGSGHAWSGENLFPGGMSGAVQALATDVDKDGDPDVIGASSTTGDVMWWENTDGVGGTWTGYLIDSFFEQTTGLTIADVNGDGAMDVVAVGVVTTTESIFWYENVGGGASWTTRQVPFSLQNPAAVVAADFDRDGDMDLAVSSQSAVEISWWRNNNGIGTSWTPFTLSNFYADASGMAVTDMDGDGDLDLISAHPSDDVVSWHENDGNGQFSTNNPLTTSFFGVGAVDVKDMDGDGDEDVLGASATTDEVFWWENTAGDGSAWQEYLVASAFDGARAVEAVDLNTDGLIDVLGAARDGDQVIWWQNVTVHRNAYFPSEASFVVDGNMNGAFSIASADFDRDGKQDLLAGAVNTGEVAWYRNNDGLGINWTKNGIGSLGNVRSLAVADLNGDGNPDVLGVGTTVSDVVWWANNGNGIFGSVNTIDFNFGGAFWVAAGDVDGDGDQDVLGAAFSTNEIAWWENLDGIGASWSKVQIASGVSGATSVSAADVDGDGDLDAIGSAYGGDTISWWENVDGTGASWSPHVIDDAINGPVSTVTADIDGDGDLDVLGASNLAQEFSWWENTDGQGTFSIDQQVIGANFDNAESVYAQDLDQDGDLDVVGAAQNDNTVVWFENVDHQGQAWNTHVLSDSVPEAVAVNVADVDRDGRPDILSAANVGNLVQWWGNRGGQFSLTTEVIAPAVIVQGEIEGIMALNFSHNGRLADSNIRLAILNLLFEEWSGNVMGGPELNLLIENLDVYVDDGSGAFEVDQDTLAFTLDQIPLISGYASLEFPEGDFNFELEAGETRTFFMVFELTPDAGTQHPHEFVVTHFTDQPANNSVANDINGQIPLRIAFAPNVSTDLFVFAPELFVHKDATVHTGQTAPVTPKKPSGAGLEIVEPGDLIDYTIYYSTTADSDLTALTLSDFMPQETAFDSFTFTGITPTLTIVGNEYRFDVGTLPAGEAGSIRILATLTDTLTEEYVFENLVSMSGILMNVPVLGTSVAGLEINISPTVDAGPDQEISLGQAVPFTAHFSDPGADDTHQAIINWGDNTSSFGVVDETADIITASHSYAEEGDYTIVITLVDNDGGSSTDSLVIHVGSSMIFLPIAVRP